MRIRLTLRRVLLALLAIVHASASAAATLPTATAAEIPQGQISSLRSFLSGVGSSAGEGRAASELQLYVGESRLFPAPGVARIAVGNGGLMTAAALDGKDVILFANAVGATTLFIWNTSGTVQQVNVVITAGDTSRIAREIAAFIGGIAGTHTSIIGDKVVIEGEDLSDSDLAKIDALSKSYPQVVNFTNKQGWEQMVLLDVKVVEFPVSKFSEIGLNWSPTGGATVAGIWSPFRRGNDGPYQLNIPTGQAGAPIISPSGEPVVATSSLNILSGINIGINAQLNLLAQQGKASILSQPQLSARNGSEAMFLAGGELPYTVSTINGPTVLFKPYGIRLTILPRVSRNGTIRATIDSEVSSIDNSISTPSGPALLTRQTKTEFNVVGGDTIILSGLISRSQSNDIDKLPVLGDIPVIGALFRSRRFRNQETELVVFVTPQVVDSRTPGLVERVQRTNERLEKRFGSAPYMSDPVQPGHELSQLDRSSAKPVFVAPPPVVVAAAAPRAVTSTSLIEDAPASASISPLPPAAATSEAAAPPGYRVKSDRLALQEAPVDDSSVLRYLAHGARVVPMIGGDGVPGWLHVLFHDGTTIEDGWLDRQSLVLEVEAPR